jgi:hypothetical protein
LLDRFGAELRITDLFRHPTVRSLASRIGAAEATSRGDDPGAAAPESAGASRGARRKAALRRRATS